MDELTLDVPEIGERRDLSLTTKITRGKNDDEVFSFIISKEEEDRHGSIVKVSGIDVSHFKKNAVVLFNHDYNRVIGTAFNIRVMGDTLQADMRFAKTEFAEEIRGQVERGEIKATSIGFIVKKWSFREDSDIWEIEESELLEFSIVTVPSNRSALIMRDAEVKSLRESNDRLEKTIDRLAQTVSVLSDRLKEPELVINGEDMIAAVENQTDQPDKLDDQETSTREANDGAQDELADESKPLPSEAKAEEDLSHDTREADKPTRNPNEVSFDVAMQLAQKAVRRKLGKE